MQPTIQIPSIEDALPDSLSGRWWVAHTKPRSEKALAADLQAIGIFHYLPLQSRTTRSRRTRRESRSVIPVFPSYLFFNADEEHRLKSLATNRIVNLLAVPRQDVLLHELRQVHRALLAGATLLWRPKLHAGDWARVIAGPLMGIEGVVMRRLSRVRLSLNVMMLGQSVSVEVPEEDLEACEPPVCSI